MDPYEPHVRRRGYFLSTGEADDLEMGEADSADGFVVRIRFVRPTLKRQVARGVSRGISRGTAAGRHTSSPRVSHRHSAADGTVRSASATDTRLPERTPR
jgi:hypothetical protein